MGIAPQLPKSAKRYKFLDSNSANIFLGDLPETSQHPANLRLFWLGRMGTYFTALRVSKINCNKATRKYLKLSILWRRVYFRSSGEIPIYKKLSSLFRLLLQSFHYQTKGKHDPAKLGVPVWGWLLRGNEDYWTNYQCCGAATVTKYDGIAYYSGHRLYISEQESLLKQTIWHTTLYATTTRREQFFSGLGVGNTTASVQDISCYRSIFQFLGRTIDKYDALKGCGLYEPNSPEIPAYIREHIENRVEPGDNAFVAA